MNENIAFEARKLKRRGAIHGYCTRDGVVYVKLGEHDKTIKIFHKNHFCKYISDYEEEEEDLFHDVSQEVNNSVYFYWLFSRVTGLLWVVFLLWATSVVLWELNFEILKHMISTKKQICSKSGCFFGLIMFLNLRIGYWMLCFYSTSVPLNVFRMSSSWLSL